MFGSQRVFLKNFRHEDPDLCSRVFPPVGGQSCLPRCLTQESFPVPIIFYRNLGQDDRALECYLKAKTLNEKADHLIGIADNLNNMGALYEARKDWPRALEAFQGALELDRKKENSPGISTDLANLGRVYEAMGEQEKALDHYLRAWRVNESLGLKERVLRDLSKIASLYDVLGKPEEAEKFRQRSQESTSSSR
jgi:tetratricopeptide (TPR) repeat protein